MKVVLSQWGTGRVILDLVIDRYEQQSKSRFLGRWRTEAWIDRTLAERAFEADELHRHHALISEAISISKERK